MKHLYLFIIFITLAGISCQKPPKKVACIGDSITEGFGLKYQSRHSYPVVLGALLGPEYEVLNFGRSATTMSKTGDFPYWTAKEFSNVLALNPQIVVVQLGTNDTKPQNWSQNDYEKSYQALIDTLKTLDSHPQIFLCKPVPVYEDKWGINDSVLMTGVIPAVQRLAQNNQLTIIDLNTPLADYGRYFPDGIHPDEQGLKMMAELVAEALRKEK